LISNALVLNVEAKPGIDAHILVCDPHHSKECRQIPTPVLIKQLVSSERQEPQRHAVAEAVFTGEKIEEFPAADVRRFCALPLLARFAEDVFVGYRPGNGSDLE
jgi:hypothetical protein